MSLLALDRVDSAPISNRDFDPQFLQWIWVLVDSLNENLGDLEGALNLLTAMNYTAVEITDMMTAGKLINGVLLYDSTNDEYVGMQAGALVKFTTTAYP